MAEDALERIRRILQPQNPQAQSTALARVVIGNLVERALQDAEQVILKERRYERTHPDGSVERGTERGVDIKRRPR